jgi:hypothetical protein
VDTFIEAYVAARGGGLGRGKETGVSDEKGGGFGLVFHIIKSMIGSGDASEVRGGGMGAGGAGRAGGAGARRRERDRAKKKGGVGMFLPFFLMLMLAASFPIFMGVWAPEAKSHLIDRVKNWRRWKEGASSAVSIGAAPMVGSSGTALPEHVVSRIEDLAKKNEELSRRLEQMEKAQLGSGGEIAVGGGGGGASAAAAASTTSSIRTAAGQGGGAASSVAGDVADNELMELAMAAAGGTVCIPTSLSHTQWN